MDKIGAYSTYQKTYTDSLVNRKESTRKKETSVVKDTEKSQSAEKVALSDKAKELLKELQKKYGNMDFIVADYETEEEAASLLSRGTKEYSVLIDPDTLEKMASDESEKEKYINILEESTGKLADMKTQLEESGEEVKRLGISIGEDGSVSYFAELEKMSEKQKERIENAREARRQERAEAAETAAEKLQEQRENKEPAWIGNDRSKSVFLQADTVEELLEKIQNVDWDSVEEKAVETSGKRIDFSV